MLSESSSFTAQVSKLCRFEVKHVSGMGGRSPPRGGAAVGAANQQFLAGSDEEADEDRQAGANAEAQPDQKASKKRKVPITLYRPNTT